MDRVDKVRTEEEILGEMKNAEGIETRGKKEGEEGISSKQRKRLDRNVTIDYIFTFIRNLDMSSSVWVLYLAYHGMSLLEIGMLEGLYHVTGMLCEVPSGAIADLFGRKKTVVTGRVLLTLSCIIMLFSRSFWGFALGFVIQALSNNLNSGSEEALLYDSMKLCDREEKFIAVSGKLNVLIEVAQAIATVAGGILAEYSYTWCYASCIVVALLGLGAALLFTEAPVLTAETSKLFDKLRKHFCTSWYVLKENKRIRQLVVYYSVIFAAQTMLYFYSQQYFFAHGLSKVQISLVMLFVGAISCLGAVCSEKLYAWAGDNIVKESAVIISLCITVYGLGNVAAAIGALLTANFFNSLLYPIQSISLNRLIPSEQRATLISLNSMAFSVFMILLFPMVGALADAFGLEAVLLWLGAGLTIVMFSFPEKLTHHTHR